MTETKHTPTPWVKEVINDFYNGDIISIRTASGQSSEPDNPAYEDDPSIAGIWCTNATSQANADFIVRACNAHDDLVAALGWALDRIDKKAPHHSIEGDKVLYQMISAKGVLLRARGEA